MDTSRSVGRNIGWVDIRILGRRTLRNPDTNPTRNPYRKQTWARDHHPNRDPHGPCRKPNHSRDRHHRDGRADHSHHYGHADHSRDHDARHRAYGPLMRQPENTPPGRVLQRLRDRSKFVSFVPPIQDASEQHEPIMVPSG
jgi:hypothetical protein